MIIYVSKYDLVSLAPCSSRSWIHATHQKGTGQIHRTYIAEIMIVATRVAVVLKGAIAAAEGPRSESCPFLRTTMHTCPAKDLRTLMSGPEHVNKKDR